MSQTARVLGAPLRGPERGRSCEHPRPSPDAFVNTNWPPLTRTRITFNTNRRDPQRNTLHGSCTLGTKTRPGEDSGAPGQVSAPRPR